jgi:hypothetical protein
MEKRKQIDRWQVRICGETKVKKVDLRLAVFISIIESKDDENIGFGN